MLKGIFEEVFSTRLHDICGQKINSVVTILVFVVVVVCIYVFNTTRKQLKLGIYELVCKKWQFQYHSFKMNFASFGLKGKYNTCKPFMSMFFRHWKDSKYPQAMFTKKNMMRHTYPCKTTSHMKNALFVPEQKAYFEFIFCNININLIAQFK